MSIITKTRDRVTSAIAGAKLEALTDQIEQLQEAIDFQDQNASQWVQLGQSINGETDDIDITVARANSRYYARRDPLYRRAISLTRNYTFGRGITWRASDPDVAKIIQAFWDDPANGILTRADGQRELCDSLLTDGELFPTFFVDGVRGRVQVSLVEPDEIKSIIPDADNKRSIRYYYRAWYKQSWSFDNRAWSGGEWQRDYYPDWNCAASYPNNRKPGELFTADGDTDGTQHSTVTIRQKDDDAIKTAIYMMQLRSNDFGLRALPSFYAAITWVSAYKGFMEDRATLTLAAATFAFKQKIKGGAAAVARMAAQLGAATLGRYGGSGGRERREGAQVMQENEAVNLEQFNFDTRAGNGYTDARILRQQVAAAVDITEPDLTGDPSVGNLASMTAMNGPQLKGFEAWQQLFADFYKDVFEFVIRQAIKYGELDPRGKDLTVEIDFPPIVVSDLPTVIGAISGLINAQSQSGIEYVAPKRLAAYILSAFGETDIKTAMSELDFIRDTSNEYAEPDSLPDDAADQIEALRETIEAAIG